MGATASISSAVKDIRISKEQLMKSHSASELLKFFNFDDYCDNHGSISIGDLQHIFSEKTDVFLTHDWGINQFNHHRVSKVNAALKSRGFTTWFDDEQMEGDIKSKMCSGIDHSRVLLAFITKRYISKVGGNNYEDNCRLEFGYGARRKTAARMLPVVMEADVRDTSQWSGQVGLVLGGSLYVDLATEDHFDEKIDEICSRVIKIMGNPLKKIFEHIDWTELNLHHVAPEITAVHAVVEKPPAAAPLLAAPPPEAAALEAASPGSPAAESSTLKAELTKWFVEKVKIVPSAADRYAQKLIDAEVGSIEKLTKKLKRNKNFLVEKGFDEDDAEEIVQKLIGSAPAAAAVPAPVVAAAPAPVAVTQTRAAEAPAPVASSARSYDHFVILQGHSGGIWGMIQLADGRICSAGSDNTLRVWNADNFQCELVLKGHTNSVGTALDYIMFPYKGFFLLL
jgi:hypothetical protein